MSKAKHTPGPWELNGSAIEVPDRFNAGMTAAIAHLYDERDVALDPDEIKANARLIAAAPEMYEALKTIEAYGLSGKGRAAMVATEMYNVACEAIAKAEGR